MHVGVLQEKQTVCTSSKQLFSKLLYRSIQRKHGQSFSKQTSRPVPVLWSCAVVPQTQPVTAGPTAVSLYATSCGELPETGEDTETPPAARATSHHSRTFYWLHMLYTQTTV